MKHRYHLKSWELKWHRTYRDLKDSRFGLTILQKVPEEILSKIPYEAIPLWIASVLTGLFAVFYERLFEYVEHWSRLLFEWNAYSIFVAAPLFIFAGYWIIDKYCPEAGGSGIPQLMAAVDATGTRHRKLVDRLLNFKVVIFKVISSLLTLFGGGAIGREGPTLQIAGSIFESVYRLIPESWAKVSQKIMLITGGASGLAAAFNTPLGGIVYVVEELTKSHIGKFRTAVFSAVIISGITAQLFLGSYLYLGYPKISPVPLSGILWVVLFAFLSGYLGSLFAQILLKMADFRRNLKNKKLKYLTTLAATLAFALIVFFTGHFAMGSGKPLINAILFESEDQPFYMFFARFFGAILTFGIGGAGGVFATSLSSGASLGTLMVGLLQVPGEYHNLLVLICMIGFLTGVTKSPFTAAILVLEMTDRHSAIFYFLLAGLIAHLASGRLLNKSFYEIRKEEIMEGEEARLAKPKGDPDPESH
ncbi:chloride channel protein [Marinilongibacter aquaticus]|uniref:chloride channel protein n=1 Tax=Marinilongibacter aquaticus TaxID=2975157 RepID=UPI0021BD90D1|nr:chloride channel protein [Marinilongibacter aquaticus]UBM58822.1 chloride channel protein [Marinilongibacter aquaticus]